MTAEDRLHRREMIATVIALVALFGVLVLIGSVVSPQVSDSAATPTTQEAQ